MALTTTTPAGGAILIPDRFMPDIIELLRPNSVVRASGAISVPMPGGNLTIPKLAGGAAVGYIGSDDEIPATEQTFGDLSLTAKKLAALVPISNDLIKYAGVNPSVDKIVVGDLTSALGTREDQAFIRDDGTGNLPKGLRFWAPAGNLIPANATVNLANHYQRQGYPDEAEQQQVSVDKHFLRLKQHVKQGAVLQRKAGLCLHPFVCLIRLIIQAL